AFSASPHFPSSFSRLDSDYTDPLRKRSNRGALEASSCVGRSLLWRVSPEEYRRDLSSLSVFFINSSFIGRTQEESAVQSLHHILL
ncbi:hypothetical protein CRM22_009572, partial [Opisthorchis felineus]